MEKKDNVRIEIRIKRATKIYCDNNTVIELLKKIVF